MSRELPRWAARRGSVVHAETARCGDGEGISAWPSFSQWTPSRVLPHIVIHVPNILQKTRSPTWRETFVPANQHYDHNWKHSPDNYHRLFPSDYKCNAMLFIIGSISLAEITKYLCSYRYINNQAQFSWILSDEKHCIIWSPEFFVNTSGFI